MKKLKVKNDVLFDRIITVNDYSIKKFIINNFGSLKDYYVKFIEKNFYLSEEEAKSIVEYFFCANRIDESLKKFFDIVKTLKIEELEECELSKKKLLEMEFIIEWFSDNQYIGD